MLFSAGVVVLISPPLYMPIDFVPLALSVPGACTNAFEKSHLLNLPCIFRAFPLVTSISSKSSVKVWSMSVCVLNCITPSLDSLISVRMTSVCSPLQDEMEGELWFVSEVTFPVPGKGSPPVLMT